MATRLLTTKLFVPPVRPDLVSRPRLIERLNTGLHRKPTLISAPAGFGKTTLLSEWAAGCERASLTKWPSWSPWASSKADSPAKADLPLHVRRIGGRHLSDSGW